MSKSLKTLSPPHIFHVQTNERECALIPGLMPIYQQKVWYTKVPVAANTQAKIHADAKHKRIRKKLKRISDKNWAEWGKLNRLSQLIKPDLRLKTPGVICASI